MCTYYNRGIERKFKPYQKYSWTNQQRNRESDFSWRQRVNIRVYEEVDR